MEECIVRKIGKHMLEVRFKTLEIEYAKQKGAHRCVIKFKE